MVDMKTHLGAFLVVAALTGACGNSGEATPSSGEESSTASVSLEAIAFEPAELEIEVGTTVT